MDNDEEDHEAKIDRQGRMLMDEKKANFGEIVEKVYKARAGPADNLACTSVDPAVSYSLQIILLRQSVGNVSDSIDDCRWEFSNFFSELQALDHGKICDTCRRSRSYLRLIEGAIYLRSLRLYAMGVLWSSK